MSDTGRVGSGHENSDPCRTLMGTRRQDCHDFESCLRIFYADEHSIKWMMQHLNLRLALECTITDASNNLNNLLFQLIGIKKMNFMFFVVMQVEVRNVPMVMFVGKIEVKGKFLCF